MDQIILKGLDIGEWDTKKITHVNFIYAEIEKQLFQAKSVKLP